MAPGLLFDSHETSAVLDTCARSASQQHPQPRSKVADIDMQSHPNEEALTEAIVQGLRLSGGCIVRGMYSVNTLQEIEGDVRPHIEGTAKAHARREDFVPSSTKLVTGLLSKSRAYALTIAGNPIWHRVCDRLLTSRLRNSWHGDEARTSVSRPQLSTTVAFSVGPGTKAQGLHRDDDIYHTQHAATDVHHDGRDTMICLFVAGKTCTKQNGATRIVPGSHLWDYTAPPPSYTEAPEKFAHAEMQTGDAFFMLGGVYHGAGENTTTDEERLVYAAFATRGYLRQEENQYLANDLEKIRKLPLHIQRFAGFGTSKPYMGWVDMEEPVRFLNPSVSAEDKFW